MVIDAPPITGSLNKDFDTDNQCCDSPDRSAEEWAQYYGFVPQFADNDTLWFYSFDQDEHCTCSLREIGPSTGDDDTTHMHGTVVLILPCRVCMY